MTNSKAFVVLHLEKLHVFTIGQVSLLTPFARVPAILIPESAYAV